MFNVRITVKGFQTILVTPQITTHVVVATAIFLRSEQILNRWLSCNLFLIRITRKIYLASRIFFNISWTWVYHLMFAETAVPINPSVRPQRLDNIRLELWVEAWTLL